jgi:hypothetical protein
MFSILTSLFAKPAPPKPPFRANLAIDYFRMPEAPAPARPVAPIVPADYFDGSTQRYRAVHPTELLNAHVELVEQIYQATGMDRLQFRRRAYPMLFFAAGFYQLVPASANNHHREPGGLLLHSLQVCRHAVHLGQFARFESDRTRLGVAGRPQSVVHGLDARGAHPRRWQAAHGFPRRSSVVLYPRPVTAAPR